MKIIIKFPTRNRPDKFFETLRKYKDYLDDQIYIIYSLV